MLQIKSLWVESLCDLPIRKQNWIISNFTFSKCPDSSHRHPLLKHRDATSNCQSQQPLGPAFKNESAWKGTTWNHLLAALGVFFPLQGDWKSLLFSPDWTAKGQRRGFLLFCYSWFLASDAARPTHTGDTCRREAGKERKKKKSKRMEGE